MHLHETHGRTATLGNWFAPEFPRDFSGKVGIYWPSDRAAARQARLRVLHSPAVSTILGVVRGNERSLESGRTFGGVRIAGISIHDGLRLPHFAGSQGPQLGISDVGLRPRSGADSPGAHWDPADFVEIPVTSTILAKIKSERAGEFHDRTLRMISELRCFSGACGI